MSAADDDPPAVYEVGTRVEVRTSFDGSWSRGFTVLGTDGRNYRLRRSSDGTELPTTFAPEDVRAEEKRSMWWI